MQIDLSPNEQEVIDQVTTAARQLECETYLVGGYVRDKLLGRPVKDIDIVCIGSGIELAEQVAAAIPDATKVTVFKHFGTAMFKVHDLEVEFVGARKESYHRDSRKPIVEDGSLKDDQLRRDFTINALAISLNDSDYGQLVDPFNGQRHLQERTIKTPLDPDITFSDDPLRMMRAIRFAAQLDFTIEPYTLHAITRNRERINIVSQERITDELNKIILSKQPSTGFKLLFETGLLELIFPEMEELEGVDIIQGNGHKDNLWHTLKVLDNLSANSTNLWLRWAAILHDIAKPPTKRLDPKAGWTFHGHDAIGARMVADIFRKLKLPLNEKMKFVQKMVLLHLRPIALTQEHVTDSAIRRLLYEAGEDIDELLTLCEADITSANKEKVKRYIQNFGIVREKIREVEEKDKLRNWQPPVSGEEIMVYFNLKPSRMVGDIKNDIRDAILDGKIGNTREDAIAFMESLARKYGIELPGNQS